MKKRRLLPIAAAAAVLLLTGCGEDPNAIHYALLTGPYGVTGSMLTEIQSGMEAAGQSQGVHTANYTAASDDAEGYKEAFSSAEDDGVYYVICAGESMEVPVYEAQSDHKDAKYILVDGEPRFAEGADSDIKSNTMCVSFDRASQGYLAGYAAIKDGKRNVTFMTGDSTDTSSSEYLAGFINGVGSAISALGVDSSSVTVNVESVGSTYLSPMRMTDALSLYDEGTELIVTDIENYMDALVLAAAKKEKTVATVGFDAVDSSSTVLYSVIPDYEGTIEWLLNDIAAEKGFEGGTTLQADAGEDALTFSAEFQRLAVVTQSDIDTILSAMAADSSVVYLESEENASAGSLAGLTAQGMTVHVQQKEPTTPSAETGLSSANTTASDDDDQEITAEGEEADIA